MKIIHDEPDDTTISTMTLAISWHLPQECQVEYCTNPTSAIVCMTENESPTGSAINVCICEEHYQKFLKSECINFSAFARKCINKKMEE